MHSALNLKSVAALLCIFNTIERQEGLTLWSLRTNKAII